MRCRQTGSLLACDQWAPQPASLIAGRFPKAAFVQQVQDCADRMSRRKLEGAAGTGAAWAVATAAAFFWRSVPPVSHQKKTG